MMRNLNRCCVMCLVLVGGLHHASRSDSFRTDPESGEVIDGTRVYTHPDTSAVLGLVITDWMVSPGVNETPKDGAGDEPNPVLDQLLIDERYVPKGFDLEIPGVNVQLCDPSKQALRAGETSIRIDRFEPMPDGSIKIEFVHSAYGIIGGAWTKYEARRAQDKWVVHCGGSHDP